MLEKFERYLYKRVFPTEPPKTIFHYTTQLGILGIIEQREMWATQVQFLNDRNEIYLTFELLKNELDSRLKNRNSKDIAKFLSFIKSELVNVDQSHLCIASFCEKGDLLSQWRGYGNLGKGYAIGFDLIKLKQIAKKHSFVLWPCVYDYELQKELVKYLIDNWCLKFSSISHTETEILSEIEIDVCQLAPIIKDESFSEEKEWRLVSSRIGDTTPGFAFRAGEYSLIPYYNFPISEHGKDCINKIVVGPSPHMELASKSLLTFLNVQKLANTKIEISRIPFRNWK